MARAPVRPVPPETRAPAAPQAAARRVVPPAARGGRRLTEAQRGLLLQIAAFGLLASGWMGVLGPLAPLLFMAAAAGLFALAPERAAGSLVRCWPLLLIGLLACLSALWSTAPGVSLRYGAQLAITVGAGIVLAGVLAPLPTIRTLFLSGLFILVLCLLSGRQGQSQGGPVLIGIVGSKNAMGALCSQIICSGGVLAACRAESRLVRLAAVPAVLLAAYVLMGSFATGAVLVTLMFAGLICALCVASRLPPTTQFAFVLLLLALLAPVWMVREDLAGYWEYFVVDVLGKDTGLTGRDYLWAHADRMIAERPLLGYGYRSTWLGDDADTIGLLRWAGLTDGAGFNFHDSYREWAVDFGLVGAVLVAIVLFRGLLATVLQAIRRHAPLTVMFFAALGVATMIRAKVELVLGPFTLGAVLIVAIAAMGYLAAADARRTVAPRTGRRPPLTPRIPAGRVGPDAAPDARPPV